tara:strand:- start:236 stop:778 length:543 start_codon:yes stop_codon:yes gene_type:complete
MPNRNHRRRHSDFTPIVVTASPVASPVSSPTASTLTTVESVTLGEHSERIIQRLKSSNKSYKSINDRFMNYNKKLKQVLLSKADEVEKLNKQLSSNKVAIKLYQDKIKELRKNIKESQELLSKTNDVLEHNKSKCICLIDKLNKVKTELPLNFDKQEWNNKNFVEYLIDLTIEDLQELQF